MMLENRKLKIFAIAIDNDTLDYTPFEIYCLMISSMDVFIEQEEYEICAIIRDYLERDDMKTIRNNFAFEFDNWTKTKKIF